MGKEHAVDELGKHVKVGVNHGAFMSSDLNSRYLIK